MKDFFTRYKESRKHPYILPGIFGIFVALSIVSSYHGTPLDFRAIQANVLEANTQKVTYPADLMMKRDSNTLTFQIGKDATDVENLHMTLLGDPAVLKSVKGNDPQVSIVSNEAGVFLIKYSLGRSLIAGESLSPLILSLEGETALALADAGFTSRETIYSMTTQGD